MTIQQAFQAALQYHQAGRLSEAEILYRQILAADPQHAWAIHHLGLLANQCGNPQLALELITRATDIMPDVSDFHCNLGKVHHDMEHWDEAIPAYRRAIALEPGLAMAHFNLGVVFYDKRDLGSAISAYEQAVALTPGYTDAYGNLGLSLYEAGRFDEAAAACRRALALNPGHVNAQNTLGGILRSTGLAAEAIEAYRRTIALDPRFSEAHSNLILTMHYSPGFDEQAFTAEFRRWNENYAKPLQTAMEAYPNERRHDRHLRIGYVSGDFCDHPVGRSILPILAGHDRQKFEVFCYAQISSPDKLSHQLQSVSDHWHGIVGLNDFEVAQLVQQHQIDILVDLALHTAHNRLLVFAQKPAPVQISFAGYPESTGLEAIGHRISDRWLEERGTPAVDGLSVKGIGHEQVYLLDSFWCYAPCGIAVSVNDLPVGTGTGITFGSLNNFCKVNAPLLELWARVLKAVKHSRLIILGHEGSHRQRTLKMFEVEGVEPHRIEFVTPRPRKDYLELYHRLDIVLDTFPYNGHVTSLDALWMGVPVVSLCGQRAVSRAGLSQLSNLGLPELVAFTEDEYVSVASRLANDLPRLQELRATLRQRVEKSVLMNAPHCTRQIESCYRAIWRQWCEGRT